MGDSEAVWGKEGKGREEGRVEGKGKEGRVRWGGEKERGRREGEERERKVIMRQYAEFKIKQRL